MITAKATYLGNLRVENLHIKSNTKYFTDAPTDNHGKGEAFSPTDTVATALANCMLTVMGIKAEQLQVELKNTYAEVTKTMASNPRRISKVEVKIHFPKVFDDKTTQILEKTAKTCPVLQSLHPDMQKDIEFIYPAK